ncbi:MAG: EpsG family protein [Caldimonas sp.]
MSVAIASGSLVAPPNGATQRLPADLVAILCAVSFALLATYPLAAFASASFLLINLPVSTIRPVRLTLALTAAIAFSMMMGARPLDPTVTGDIDVYYDVYRELAAGNLEYLGAFGGGLEIALPVLCYLWGLMLPALSINGLMFCLALASSLLLLVWVEKAFFIDRRWQDPALMGVCILMLNLYFSTQLVRQFMALIVLLYAFSASGARRRWFYAILAATFHLSAIPFFLIFLLARRGPWGWAAIVGLAVAVRLLFWQLVGALDLIPEAVAERLAYYVDNSQEFTDADIASLRMITLLGGISLVSIFCSRTRVDRETRDWIALPWIAAIVHFALLPIPLASLRTTLMVHGVAPGLIAYQMLWRRSGTTLAVVLNVLLTYKVVSFMTATQSGNLLSSAAMLASFVP